MHYGKQFNTKITFLRKGNNILARPDTLQVRDQGERTISKQTSAYEESESDEDEALRQQTDRVTSTASRQLLANWTNGYRCQSHLSFTESQQPKTGKK